MITHNIPFKYVIGKTFINHHKRAMEIILGAQKLVHGIKVI